MPGNRRGCLLSPPPGPRPQSCPGRLRRPPGITPRSRPKSAGNGYAHRCPLSFRALYLDVAAMLENNLANVEQAPVTGRYPVLGDAETRIEDAFHLVGCHAAAVIAYGDLHGGVLQACENVNTPVALHGVNGITEQAGKDKSQQLRPAS